MPIGFYWRQELLLLSKAKFYFQLLKSGLANSILVTVVPGLLVGSSLPSWDLVIFVFLGTWLCACSSFVYNQIIEKESDAFMRRTQNRPLVKKNISVTGASIFGSTLLGLGLIILSNGANPLSAIIALFSFIYYVFIYTVFKKRTHWNTILGGVSGSVGPLIGEAAVSGRLSEYSLIMFVLLFLWQPAHFWCLSIYYKEDYARAKIPVLPVIRGDLVTIQQALLYQISICVFMVIVVVKPISLLGPIFLIPSILWGGFVTFAMWRLKNNISSKEILSKTSFFTPLKVFFMTILHMLIWHLAMSVDLYVRLWNI